MGLMFTALSTISLLEISREKMAQASAITNSIRQLGGSLGVALLATLLTYKSQFSQQIFGGAIKPGFRNISEDDDIIEVSSSVPGWKFSLKCSKTEPGYCLFQISANRLI